MTNSRQGKREKFRDILPSISTSSSTEESLLESLMIWRNKIDGTHRIRRCKGFWSCSQSKKDEFLWIFVQDLSTLDDLHGFWSSLQEGGVIAGASTQQLELVKVWAATEKVRIHYVGKAGFWAQRQHPSIKFRVWNQQIEIKYPEGHAVNPSICPHPADPNKRLFAFRTTEGLWENGRIWIGELDSDDLQFVARPYKLDLAGEEINCEDPRIFLLQGTVWLSYVASNWPRFPTLAWQHIVPLEQSGNEKWEPAEEPAKFGSPFQCGQEKNWIFFSVQDEELLVLYSSAPEWRIHRLFLDSPEEYLPHLIAPGVCWPFGHIRGGTPMIAGPKGNLWTFFHSSMRHLPSDLPTRVSRYNGAPPKKYCDRLLPQFGIWNMIKPHNRYFCGLLEIDGETLAPLRISADPLLYQTDYKNWRAGSHVIWPAGAFHVGDEVTVAYGLDDRSCHCARFSAAHLEESLVPI